MNYIDKNIPIICGECKSEHIEEGLANMYQHILDEHKEYNKYEADVFAVKWLEDAYDRMDRLNEKLTRYHHGN